MHVTLLLQRSNNKAYFATRTKLRVVNTEFFRQLYQTISYLSMFKYYKPNTRDMDRFKELIQSPKPVLVDFYAEWCGPCKIMKPRLLDVAERIGADAKIVEIDVDREKEIAERCRIQSVPTFIIYKNGEQLWRQTGVISTIALLQLLKDYQ